MQTTNTIEISGLEYQVDHLLRMLDRLRAENETLRQKLAQHARERSQLIEKKHHVASKIKKIITQLKGELT